jgi:hypothetical protein
MRNAPSVVMQITFKISFRALKLQPDRFEDLYTYHMLSKYLEYAGRAQDTARDW